MAGTRRALSSKCGQLYVESRGTRLNTDLSECRFNKAPACDGRTVLVALSISNKLSSAKNIFCCNCFLTAVREKTIGIGLNDTAANCVIPRQQGQELKEHWYGLSLCIGNMYTHQDETL